MVNLFVCTLWVVLYLLPLFKPWTKSVLSCPWLLFLFRDRLAGCRGSSDWEWWVQWRGWPVRRKFFRGIQTVLEKCQREAKPKKEKKTEGGRRGESWPGKVPQIWIWGQHQTLWIPFLTRCQPAVVWEKVLHSKSGDVLFYAGIMGNVVMI